jgi:hemerythrin superfamily protein
MRSNGRAEDVLDLLMQEHRDLEGLLRNLRYAGTAEKRRENADQLIASLVRHSLVEETYVVPLVRDYLIHGEESVAQDRHEHEELEQLLRDLESLDGANPRFMEVVLDLQATLAQHIALEEGQQFPQVRLAAPAGELAALRERVQAVERIATPGPHARADDRVLLVDPGEGMVDRLRDALAGPAAS